MLCISETENALKRRGHHVRLREIQHLFRSRKSGSCTVYAQKSLSRDAQCLTEESSKDTTWY